MGQVGISSSYFVRGVSIEPSRPEYRETSMSASAITVRFCRDSADALQSPDAFDLVCLRHGGEDDPDCVITSLSLGDGTVAASTIT